MIIREDMVTCPIMFRVGNHALMYLAEAFISPLAQLDPFYLFVLRSSEARLRSLTFGSMGNYETHVYFAGIYAAHDPRPDITVSVLLTQ